MSKAASSNPKSGGAFLKRAERAFERAAERVITESRQLKMKPVSWKQSTIAKSK